MPGIGDYGGATWLSMLFGAAPVPDYYWVALLSDEPGESMDGDIITDLEPSDASYHRVAVPANGDNWATNNGFIANLNDVDFGVPLADWGDVSYFALVNAVTSGDLYAWGDFLNPQYVAAGYQMIVPAGGLILTLDTLDTSIA